MQSVVRALTSFEKFDMVVVELETGLQKSLHPVTIYFIEKVDERHDIYVGMMSAAGP